ncbi:hypothetical protein D3C86_1360420 [compost metagenome]
MVAAGGAQGVVLLPGHLPGQLFELMDRPGDQPFDLPGDHQPQQHAEDQNPEAGGQGAGVERHRQFAAGHQQQVPRRSARAGQGDHLIAAKLGGLPGFDVPVALRQLQLFAMLQLRQAFALAVIEGGRAQRGIGIEFIEQALGTLLRLQRLGHQARVGNQAADRLQGLRRHAFLRDVIRGADKSQVGHQQDGGQQHQQSGQEFLADRQVFKTLAQWHQVHR